MRSSLFGRNFMVYALVVLLSFTILGSIFVYRVDGYTNEKTRQQVYETTERAGDSAHAYFLFQASVDQAFSGLKPHFSRNLQLNLCQLAEDCNGTIFVADGQGKIFYIANREGCYSLAQNLFSPADADLAPWTPAGSETVKQLPEDAARSLLETGKYSDITDFDGIFPDRHFIYGLRSSPVGDPSDPAPVMVLVAVPANHSISFIHDIQDIFLTLTVLVLIITLLATYLVTRQTVKPIRQLSAISRDFARGDFHSRMPLPHRQDELYDMAVSFNSMADSVQTMEDSRRTLMASVSHDLRTPMTTISGFVDAMLDGTIPPEKQTEYLSIISSETKRLSRMASSMLQVSRLESGGELKKSLFDLSEMIRRIVISFDQKLEQKRLDIVLDIPDQQMITADHDSIFQVVYNLFDNAVKFTEDKGNITICLTAEGGNIRFNILNSGQEIPAEHLKHIFDRFYKADTSRGLNKTGSGLGLYIVKTIVNRHGGDIYASSQDGKTEFCFTLPING